MTAAPIILGHAGEQPLELDLDRLIGSHLGIVANAGGGKSGLIRRLLEQTHGRIQHIVLDIEDEFYSLRERYDYVIAGGDGDAPATVDNAAALARGALEHGFSLICQLNDLGGAGAREFVDAFLSAMLTAPRDLWRPCLIVIDETQRFDADSIRMLTERGRKRGFTAILASQRLPKIDANIRGDLNNWIMGRVGQSLDRRIMADQLGMTKAGERELASIQPRHFWAMGPALSPDPVLFEVADVETTMVRPGQAKVPTPPPPEALRQILAGLAVPAQSEDEIKAAIVDMVDNGVIGGEVDRLRSRVADLQTERDSLREMVDRKNKRIEAAEAERDRLHTVIGGYQRAFEAQAGILADISWPSVPRKDGTMPHEPLVIPPVVPAPNSPAPVANEGDRHEVAQDIPHPVGEGRRPSDSRRPSTDEGIPPRWQRILDAIAWAHRMLKSDAVERNIVAWFAGTSPKSSGYQNDLGAMRTRGLICYPGSGLLALDNEGKALANWPTTPPTKQALLDAIKSNLEPRFCRILDALWARRDPAKLNHLEPMRRPDLAETIGVSASSSGFQNDLGKLRTLGLIDYPERGMVGLGKVLR